MPTLPAGSTVTARVPVTDPTEAASVATPGATPVATPDVAPTESTDELLDVQVTALLSVAPFASRGVAVNVTLWPTVSDVTLPLTETDATVVVPPPPGDVGASDPPPPPPQAPSANAPARRAAAGLVRT